MLRTSSSSTALAQHREQVKRPVNDTRGAPPPNLDVDALKKPLQTKRPSSASSSVARERKSLPDSQQVRLAVQQAVNEQQALASAHHQQLQSQVVSMGQLMQAQAAGMMQQQQQIVELHAKMAPQSASKPELHAQLGKMQQHQGKMGQLHHCMQGQLSKLQQMQTQAQQRALMQTQAHIGGLYKLLQIQGEQLQSTQAQVAELQAFAGHAKHQVLLLAKSQESDHRRLSRFETQLQEQFSSSSQQQQRASTCHGDVAEHISVVASHSQSVMGATGAAVMGPRSRPCSASSTSAVARTRSSVHLRDVEHPRNLAFEAKSPDELDKEARKARIAALEEELTQLHTMSTSSDEEFV